MLLGLSSLFWFSGDRGYFHRHHFVDWVSARAITQAAGLAMRHGVAVQFLHNKRAADGTIAHATYQRYPVGVYALLRLTMLPFPDSASAQIQAARMLMLAAFSAAAVLAYCALARLVGSRWIAVGATLLAFSSYPMLNTALMINNEGSVGLFGVLLVFHGMVVCAQGGRFGGLLVKVCAALLLDWHVYGIVAPFACIGVLGGLARAWRSRPADATAGAGAGALMSRVARGVRDALRGRPALLGLVALLFGFGVLGYNFAGEIATFGGKRALAEFPLVDSITRRSGQDPGFNLAKDWFLAWPAFLELQLHRIGGMSVPFALPALPTTWNDQPAFRVPAGTALVWVGALVLAGSLIAVLLARRKRMLFGTLFLSGFCWMIPMRHHTADPEHTFETVFWLGIPLALLALFPVGASAVWRRWGLAERLRCGWVGPVCAAAALAVFVLSSARMGGVERATAFERRQHAVMAELDAIRGRVRGHDVLVAIHRDALLAIGTVRYAFRYYLSGAVLQYDDSPRGSERNADFAISRERVTSRHLLTPDHRFVFLYDSVAAVDEITDAHRRKYAAISAAEPTLRAPFDIHLRGNRIFFAKANCSPADTAGRFMLHVAPVQVRALPPPARRLGFDNLDFWFGEHGVAFDDKCLAEVPLPPYAIASVRTGRLASGQGPVVWRVAFHTPAGFDALRRWRDAPARLLAKATFDVRLTAAGMLVFVRNPCVAEDVRARFFLHVFPADADDLPWARRSAGFDNFDFQFDERGAVLDGGCVAAVPLPEYPALRVYTGQWTADGPLWQADFDPARSMPES